MNDQEISLSQAALRIGKPWPVAHRLMLSGELGPARQNDAGRWQVTAVGVDAYLERAKAADNSARAS
jgi:hypothetical protein